MRGIAGHPADTDRDTGFKEVLADYPDIKVVPSADGVAHRLGPGHGHQARPTTSSPAASTTTIQGIWTSGMDSQVVDAIKAADKPYVPIVGADLGAFVNQLLDPTGYAGLEGAAVTNTAAVGGAGVNLALKLLNGETVDDRPGGQPSRTRSCSSRSSPTTRPTRARRCSQSWQVDGSRPALAARSRRSRATRRTPRSRPSPARARASSLPRPVDQHGGCRLGRHPLAVHYRGPMTVTTTDLLLEATGVAKTYGAVVALKAASLAVRPGEVHALMGANGAGKSTLVKILTGAVRPDGGTISVRGRRAHRPLAGRGAPRRPRLRLPGAGAHPGPGHPVQPAPDRDAGRAVPPLARASSASSDLDLSSLARHVPLASLRIIDLARALAIEPDVLMLDEMTAALPANLTERVLEVVGRQRGGDRSVIFISHRMIEIAAVCDRATVLREGETVGVVDVTAGLRGADRRADARPDRRGHAGRRRATAAGRPRAADGTPRICGPRPRRAARSSRTSRSTSTRARCSASSRSRARARTSCSTSSPAPSARAAASCSSMARRSRSAIPPTPSGRASSTSPADRAEALLMQRSVRENIALPFSAPAAAAGARSTSATSARRSTARSRRCRSTRAPQGEVRRLSGGNQQKVTIARWVAGGVQTMLCFDPTRGIDIRTKHQIYVLLRDLAEAGAAVLLYTSELKEIQLACDRAIVIFGGRVVAEIDVADADEPTLLRAAYNLRVGRADARGGRGRGRRRRCRRGGRRGERGRGRRRSTTERRSSRRRAERERDAPPTAPVGATEPAARRRARVVGAPQRLDRSACSGSSSLLLVFTKLIQPSYGVDRHPGPGDLGAAAGAGRRRPGDRRHLRRHRPLDRRR